MTKIIASVLVIVSATITRGAYGCRMFHEMLTLPTADSRAMSAIVVGYVQTTLEQREGARTIDGLRLRVDPGSDDGASDLEWYPVETMSDCQYTGMDRPRLEARFPSASRVTTVFKLTDRLNTPTRVIQYAGSFAAIARVPDGVQLDPIESFDFETFRRDKGRRRPADATNAFYFEEYQFYRAAEALPRLGAPERMVALKRLAGYSAFNQGVPSYWVRNYSRLLDWAQVGGEEREQLLRDFMTRAR